jgi:hypothetical protein
VLSWLRNSPLLVKCEGSLPCSQKPATGLCPEPDEYSPHPYILFILRSILIKFHLYLDLPSGFFLRYFPSKILSYSCVHRPLDQTTNCSTAGRDSYLRTCSCVNGTLGMREIFTPIQKTGKAYIFKYSNFHVF